MKPALLLPGLAASSAAVDVIGLISGVLGIVQFGMDHFGGKEKAKSVIKIGVGLDVRGGLDNSGGHLPDVRLWNEDGRFLGGKMDPGNIKSGETQEIKVKHDGNVGQQATYTLFSGNTDAICIAFASITWPDGNEYAWIGDWGKQCGATWYWSSLYIQGTSHMPTCMWIDADGNQPQTGFHLHWPEFVSQDGLLPSDKDVAYFCDNGRPFKYRHDPDPRDMDVSPRFRRGESSAGAETIGFEPSPEGELKHAQTSTIRSSKLRRRNQCFADTLVVDDNLGHSTKELCESETSDGPDFVNIADGNFCRMSDKSLWPLCADFAADNCFDPHTNSLRVDGVVARDQEYKNVITWK
ncbi:hypothetical protein ACJ41O_014719 [Fusarium nematophilum]